MLMEAKSPKESEVETAQLMMPHHSNPSWLGDHVELGSVNGGAILNLIDNVAGLCALRHCRSRVVTASIDRMSFINPVRVGYLLVMSARINYVGRSSLEVEVTAKTENLSTGEQLLTGIAFLTMVAVNDAGRPIPAPPLLLETDEEKERFEAAKLRIDRRKQDRYKD